MLKEPEVIAVPEPVAEKEKEDFFSMTLRPFKRKAQTLPDQGNRAMNLFISACKRV